jgi:hypothetical protein
VPRQNHIREESLTLAKRRAILQPVRAAFRTIVALRIALSVRRDLLLECVALRRQLAAVARWHREGLRGCWRRRSRRRPGRPCIDADLRALIRRMATENHLWGAPRIHGELLKLGVVVSERTVSRYLPDRETDPSQTWRTFLAHHLVALAPTSSVTSNPPGDAVDASDARLCLAPSIRDGSCVIHRWVVVEWQPSFPRPSPGARVAQDLLYRRRGPSNKEPPLFNFDSY